MPVAWLTATHFIMVIKGNYQAVMQHSLVNFSLSITEIKTRRNSTTWYRRWGRVTYLVRTWTSSRGTGRAGTLRPGLRGWRVSSGREATRGFWLLEEKISQVTEILCPQNCLENQQNFLPWSIDICDFGLKLSTHNYYLFVYCGEL